MPATWPLANVELIPSINQQRCNAIMTERTRDFLKPEFRDGERPSGADFADLIDSFLNKASDGLAVDADGNLVLSRGLRLGNSAGTVAGGLRFNGGQVQFNDGTNWVNVAAGGGGAFQPFGATNTITGAVVYTGGSVGIGSSALPFAAAPTYRLEVNLGPNTGTTEQVRFGNAVCGNGAAAFAGYAVFSHQNHASNTNYALRQGPSGNVHINAATGQPVSIRQNGNQVRLGVSATGNVVVGGEADLAGAGTAIFQVAGEAFKSTGSGSWLVTSDARVKEDVRELEAGLAQLRRVRPVRFRYNGRAGTPAGVAGVGVLGQEIEKIFPEMIRRVPGGLTGEPDQEDLRIYDGSALTFVLVNAVKELAGKVERLEQALAEALKKRDSDGNST